MVSWVVVVFDFDETIIDVDSDKWVVDGMGIAGRFEECVHTMSLNTIMDKLMGELYEQGKTIEDIADCLKTAPLHPEIISAIKTAYSLGCDLLVVSDAHTFFIDTILKHHGLLDHFTEGLVIERIRESVTKDSTEANRFIYLGDGSGDYCPSLELGGGNKVMPRKDHPLWKLIQGNPLLLRAERFMYGALLRISRKF